MSQNSNPSIGNFKFLPNRKNYLLSIGIDNYQHVGKLSNAVRDAKMVSELLAGHYGFDDIQDLYDQKASRRSIRNILREQINRVGTNDNLVIYFSGHGHYDKVLNEAYWVPADARYGDDTDYISYDYIRRSIAAMKAHHIFLVVDSCYSGAIMVRNRDKALTRFEKEPSRWMLASGRNEVVPDGVSGENSPFATQLLDVLERYSGEGIRVSDLVNKVTTAVIHDSDQTPIGRPIYQAGDKGGEFVFRRKLSPKTDILQQDLVSWNKAKLWNTQQAYREYLQQFPKGEFVELAESRLAQQQVHSRRSKDMAAWKQAKEQDSLEGYEAYLKDYPEGEFKLLAEKNLERKRKQAHAVLAEAHRKEKFQAYVEEGRKLLADQDFEGAIQCWEEALGVAAGAEKTELAKALKKVREQAGPKVHPLIEKMGLALVWVEGGTFKLGNEVDCTVSSFEIGKYPITQAQWEAVMGENPSYFKGCPECPVESVSWEDADKFIKTLNEKTGGNYRLPTETEWEFAARGGKDSQGFEYAGSNNLKEVGWFWENSGDNPLGGDWELEKINKNNCKTHPVGQKKPNELGLYDMSGNVWEWCQDWYGDYPPGPLNDPPGPGSGRHRVLRGGSWNVDASYCRVSFRSYYDPSDRLSVIGFRLARGGSR